jgi:large subunit ribosomal protein L5
MKSIKEKNDSSFEALKGEFGYINKMQAPRLVKVIISTGVGSVKDKKRIELIGDRLGKISGQKAAVRGAKQSISNFKIRQGDPAGYQITLRGKRMNDFLDRLVNIAFPRTRDFRGLSPKSVDSIGNYTVGIREHTIFPETSDEDIKDVFGLAVTVVTSSNNPAETIGFLKHLGFPLKTTDTGTKEEAVSIDTPRNSKKAGKAKEAKK